MSTHDHSCCAASRNSKKSKKKKKKKKRKKSGSFSKQGMVELEGGSFLMGTDDDEGFPEDGEGPVREVTINPFYMDSTHVTNADFGKFINATGYITEAEQFGWSFVFFQFLNPETVQQVAQVAPEAPWWVPVEGAFWRQPEGPGTSIINRMQHPVIHISWNDAVAYADWAGKRLPTEAEWEFAARGGLEQSKFPWGDELVPNGKHRCNIWQGSFPDTNSKEDGFMGTSPVKSFKPNGFGLYDTSGNTWEWCADWFSPDFHVDGPRENPKGPPAGQARVMRGGSYLCHDSYCNRYRVAARTANTPDSSTGNIGFRCAADA
ncbi:MAG: SUMF1/EgtB/PvdO family nonheme iron enzyme [Candidatus Marinimicrobia bacterium]|nr:SUMF1/EgtB/PvdO family nonheme iron enzyme [Candidatus Neomarinimicrobiota bacterium]